MASGTITPFTAIAKTVTKNVAQDVGNLRVRKMGNMVFLEGYIVPNNQSYTIQNTTLCTFPADCIPTGFRFFVGTASTNYIFRLNLNGQLQFNSSPTFSSTTYIFINGSYAI